MSPLAVVMEIGADLEGLRTVGTLIQVLAGVCGNVFLQYLVLLEGLLAQRTLELAFGLVHILLVQKESICAGSHLAAFPAHVGRASIMMEGQLMAI